VYFKPAFAPLFAGVFLLPQFWPTADVEWSLSLCGKLSFLTSNNPRCRCVVSVMFTWLFVLRWSSLCSVSHRHVASHNFWETGRDSLRYYAVAFLSAWKCEFIFVSDRYAL